MKNESLEKIENIVEHIRKARYEALIRNIEANAIVINKSFAITQGFYYPELSGYMSPMIFGMKMIYENDRLPFDASFAVLNSTAMFSEREMLTKENEELRQKLAEIKKIFE